MTTIKLYTVNCDADQGKHAEGCPAWIGNEDTPQLARSLARRHGWKRTAGKDYSAPCYEILENSVWEPDLGGES